MIGSLYNVRALGSADIPLLRQLNRLFGEAFCDDKTYGKHAPSDRYLETLLAKEHIVVIAALTEGIVVAGLVAYELQKLESERSEFYIYDLAVDAGHRRRGLATALIDRLREFANQLGSGIIFVQAD